MEVVIERLTDLPADALAEMLAESEQDGWRFVRRLAEEWENGSNRFDRPGEGLFAARAGERIIGVCGLNIDPYSAAPDVGRLRRLYVLRGYRRHGAGRKLVRAVIGAAAGTFRSLRVRTESPQATALYERLGFRRVAAGADCSHILELPSLGPPDAARP
jgi:ribosomal protein S18 acetylase RimI-like enzyme